MQFEKNKFIYVIGHIANEGIKIIIENNRKYLVEYFNKNFIENIYDKILNEYKILSKFENDYEKSFDTTHILPITKGGIFTSLWDLSKIEKVGMDFSQREIPIYQESIEICNLYDLLPYRLLSKHNYLVFEDVEWFNCINTKYNNINIKCIGKLYNKKECARIDGDVKSYLTKDYKDEIDKIIPKYTKNKY